MALIGTTPASVLRIRYTPKSKTRNRIFSTHCMRNVFEFAVYALQSYVGPVLTCAVLSYAFATHCP
eukprot:336469-Rhodomonas_salina.1